MGSMCFVLTPLVCTDLKYSRCNAMVLIGQFNLIRLVGFLKSAGDISIFVL